MASPVKNALTGLDGTYSREQLLEWKARGSLGVFQSMINLRKPDQIGIEIKNGKVKVLRAGADIPAKPVEVQQIPTVKAPESAAPPTGVFQTKTVKKTGEKVTVEVFPQHHLSKKMPLVYSDAVLADMSAPVIKKYLRGTWGFERGDIYLLKKPQCIKLVAWCKDHYMTYWETKA